jgi:hypothetical protein
MKKKELFKLWKALLVMGLVGIVATPLYAATGYEVSGVAYNPTVTASQFVRMTDDYLTVSWTKPSGTDVVMGYFLKFNASSTALTGTALDDSTYDFKTDSGDQLFYNVPRSTFDAYDSNTIHYLHIRTQYLDSSTGYVVFSDDVVSAEIRIDNVAPTGNLTLDPTSGSSKVVGVTMSPSEAIQYYWLSDSDTFPGGTGMNYSQYPSGAVELKVGTSYGNVTINAWFQDMAGNRSTAPSAWAVYDYTAPVSIQYAAVSSINVGATIGFTVDNATHYDWTITPSATGVAEFQGGGVTLTDASSVTVVGKAAGTFTVTATPTAGGTELKTGTITVVQNIKIANISLAVGWNLISIPFQPSNTAMGTVLSGIANKYSIVWGEFNPETSAWKNYNPLKTVNSLATMEPNKGYWINVSEACTMTISGALAATKGGSLSTGWNLIGFAGEADTAITTVLSGIANKYSIVWGEFNPSTSAWKNYNPLKTVNSLTSMGPGKGYWVNMVENATLAY